MSNILTTSRGGVGPPLWLNHRWGWNADDPNGAFDEAEIVVYLDRIGAETPTRVELTQDSDGVTVTATTIQVDQSSEWVGDNLSPGKWRVHFLVDGHELAWWIFEALTPDAGLYVPGGGSSL